MHRNYKSIKVWQKADELFDCVCEDVAKWPKDRIANAIVFQLLDSLGSISANIAEGYGRGSPGEFQQFLRYARGSSEETDNWLFKAMKKGFIAQDRYNFYTKKIEEINKMVNSFMKRLRSQSKK